MCDYNSNKKAFDTNVIITYIHDKQLEKYKCMNITYEQYIFKNTSFVRQIIDMNQIVQYEKNTQILYIDLQLQSAIKEKYFIVI